MGIRALFNKIYPVSNYPYFEKFDEQMAKVLEAAEILSRFTYAHAGEPLSKKIADEIKRCEEGCDKITGEILGSLDKSFITPVDREDIATVASCADDIMDDLEKATIKMADYHLPVNDDLESFLLILKQCVMKIRDALGYLKKNDARIHDAEKAVKVLENDSDRLERKVIKESYELNVFKILGEAPGGGRVLTGADLALVMEKYMLIRKYREVGETLERAVDNARKLILEIRKVYTKFA